MHRQAVADRFLQVNGDHPMTAEDDAYVTRQYRVLTELCAELGQDCDEVRQRMLAGQLPLPSYLRSDGAEMVPADYFAVLDEAGGVAGLERWFRSHWADETAGLDEWEAYLSGQYVCLRSVTPATIRRKGELVAAIEAASNTTSDTGSDTGSDAGSLKALVDELDALEPDFTAYDRLRFGGPVSRDTHITAIRERLTPR